MPPDRADLAASYVHGKVAGIIADLAAHEPGGRNAAVYTAALKVGSTLGAVRATPGAEHAAAEWTDQAAEDALMEAAERNGYIGKDGAAEARSAIRSGLRNGLRNPRPLPDFTARPDAPGHKTTEGSGRHWTGSAAPVARQAAATHAGQSPDGSRRAGQNRPAWVRQAPTQEALTADSVSEVLRAAGFVASSDARKAAHAPEGYQVQATPDGGILLSHMAIDEPVNGVSPSARKEQMLARYAHALQIAGIHVTSADGNSLAMKPPPVRPPAAVRADSERAGQIAASRAALAADEAYRAGEFDQARQLIDEAADLDPARTDLWQQHRIEIAAKRLSAQAREAAAEGDSGRADELIAEARQLDPRMQMLWHRHLAGVHSGQHAGQARGPATAGNDRNQNHSARQLARERTADARAAPQWPERSTFSHSSQTSSASEAHGPLPRPRKEPGVSTQPAAEEAKQQVSNGEAEQQPAARRPDAGLARREPESATRVPGAGHEQSISTPSLGPGLSDRPPTDPEGRGINGGDWRDALIEKERRDWQPKLAGAREVHPRAPQAEAPEIGA